MYHSKEVKKYQFHDFEWKQLKVFFSLFINYKVSLSALIVGVGFYQENSPGLSTFLLYFGVGVDIRLTQQQPKTLLQEQ